MNKSPVTVLLLVSMSVISQAALSETLFEVIRSAVSQSPDVLEIKSQKTSRVYEVKAAEAGYLPKLDLTAGIGYEYTDSPSTRPLDDEELERGEFGLTLRQNLFDGKATEAEVERQQARLEASEYQLKGIINTTALEITQNYLNVLRYRDVIRLATENRDVHLRIQDQIRLRSEAGVGRGADYDQINARVSLVEANLIAANVNLRDAETNYRRVVGNEAGKAMEVVPEVKHLLPASLEEALALAEGGNFIYRSSASDVLQAQAQHKASLSNHYPRVDFEVSANLDNDLDGVDGYNNDLSAMLRLRYNLYNGGADEAQIASSASKIKEAQEIRYRSYRQLEEELRLAWAAFEATNHQLVLLQKQVDYNIATRDAYVKQFNIGQRTLLDLLNTENELFEARESLVSTRMDNVLAQYRIIAVMGRMAEAVQLDVNDIVAVKE